MSQVTKELIHEIGLPLLIGVYLGYVCLDQYYIKELIG